MVNRSSEKVIRNRLRQKAERLEKDILADIALVYQKPVEEWDWEELSKGCPRDPDTGNFPKGKPKWITPAVQGEVQRRMREMTEQELMTHAFDAIRTLSKLLSNEDEDDFGKPIVSPSVKLQAAQYILNQTIGTPKAKVEVTGTVDPTQEFLADLLVNPDGEPSHGMIVEGSVITEEEDEDDADG